MNKEISVLSTRVLYNGNLELIQSSSLNWIQKDFITIKHSSFCIDELQEFLLFTSQNTIRSVIQTIGDGFFVNKKVFCVGIKTKEFLESLGAIVYCWAHYAQDLSRQIILEFPGVSITFFNGNLRRNTLVDAFDSHGITYKEIEVYKTLLTPKRVQESFDAICFYSPSAVESFLMENDINNKVCFCIGQTTKDALKGVTDNIVLASMPTLEQTIKACIAYYK